MIQKFLNSIGLGSLWQWLGERIKYKSAKVEYEKEAIKGKATTKVVEEKIKQDKKKDKHLRDERKILYEFHTKDTYEAAEVRTKIIYRGSKDEVLKMVTTDPARAIKGTRNVGEQKDLRKQIRQSVKKYFIIAVHPLTVH